jgi:hypothetical protein
MLACSCRLDILAADHADAGGVKQLLSLIKPEAGELKHLTPDWLNQPICAITLCNLAILAGVCVCVCVCVQHGLAKM